MIKISPAATVLIIREIIIEDKGGTGGIEVLLLKRSSRLAFAPSFWVFPGGRIDPEDGEVDEANIKETAKVAAAREAYEEARIKVDPKDLYQFCHWTTPTGPKRRFATWFFHCLAASDKTDIIIDDSEIVDHVWLSPQDALSKMATNQIPLLPPTFISLERIKHAQTYEAAKAEFERTGVVTAAPKTTVIDGIFTCLYKGDAGYETGDINQSGSRHRLVINQTKGDYHFEYEGCKEPPVNGGAFSSSRSF